MEDSLDFYRELGFIVISGKNPVLLTDGKAVVEVNPDRFARAGIKLYKPSWADEISALGNLTAVTNLPDGYLFADPTGTWVYLIESEFDLKFKPAERSFSLLGDFAGLSLETADMPKSARILEILGFSINVGSVEQNWATLANEDGFTVSLMKPLCCPHLFFNPSMTYFNGKNNLYVIENIRAAGIPIVEEITHFNAEGVVDNVIIRDPGGYGFFVFSD